MVLALVLAMPLICSAGGFDNYYLSYQHKLAASDKLVFYSSCSKANGSAAIYLEPEEKKGLLVEKLGGSVVNLASVAIHHRKLLLVEANGGVYSYKRIQQFINWFLFEKFSILQIKDGSFILPAPVAECPNSS